MYHGRGHLNASFKLAQILRQQFHVTFAAFDFFKKDIQEQGFEFHGLRSLPFALGFEPWMNTQEGKKNVYWNVLKDRWTDRIYKQRESEFKVLLATLNPTYILIDSWQSTDFVVLYPLLKDKNIKVAFLQTMLSTIVEQDLPPLNGLSMPDSVIGIKKDVYKFYWHKTLKTFKQTVKYFGRTNQSILKKHIRINKIPAELILNKHSLFAPSFRFIPEFVLAPVEFEFCSHFRAPHQRYIGFLPDMTRSEETEQAVFNKLKDILARKESTNHPLIYCSFGTIDYGENKHIKTFLLRLIQAVGKQKWICILCCQEGLIPKTLKLPENLFWFHKVPQLQILKNTNVFITHGGLNSIKEAVYLETPMIVYPASADVDQNGNSSRVVFHKLGLRGSMKDDVVEEIREKIEDLLNNPVYPENLKLLHEKDLCYTPVKFLTLFNKVVVSGYQ